MAVHLMYLYFRNADGSMALAGWWALFIAVVGVGGQAVLMLVSPSTYLRIFARGFKPAKWLDRPAVVFRLWACLCLVLAAAATYWILHTAPGKLY